MVKRCWCWCLFAQLVCERWWSQAGARVDERWLECITPECWYPYRLLCERKPLHNANATLLADVLIDLNVVVRRWVNASNSLACSRQVTLVAWCNLSYESFCPPFWRKTVENGEKSPEIDPRFANLGPHELGGLGDAPGRRSDSEYAECHWFSLYMYFQFTWYTVYSNICYYRRREQLLEIFCAAV